MNQDSNMIDEQQKENKNILFKPKPITFEEEVVDTKMAEINNMNNLNNTQSFLNRSSMMTYSKM
jgi:hypothetical protein